MATIPDALPPEYAAELTKLQSQAPPMGWAFVQAPHDGRARRRLAEQIRELRAPPGGGGLARPGASRARAWTATALACKLQYRRHAVGGRSRPHASSTCCSPSTAAWTRRSTPPRSPRRSARGCARSSTTGARPSTSRSTATCSPASDAIRVPRVWPELSTGRLLTLDWLEGAPAARAQGRHARDPQPPRAPRCSPPGGCRSAASASSTATRISAIIRCSTRGGEPGRHQPARLWLHPHLPAELRRRRGRPLQRPARRRRRLVVHAYETWGFRGSTAT